MTIVYMLPVIVQYGADSMSYSDDYSLYMLPVIVQYDAHSMSYSDDYSLYILPVIVQYGADSMSYGNHCTVTEGFTYCGLQELIRF